MAELPILLAATAIKASSLRALQKSSEGSIPDVLSMPSSLRDPSLKIGTLTTQ